MSKPDVRTPESRNRHPGTSSARSGPKKILLVDDSRTVLLAERTLLTATHYEVITAEDGQEAVQKALLERPDIILMDVVMPRMDGFEAVRRLRADERTRDIPIIMVTTRGEMGSVERSYQTGCNDFVSKPVHGPELLAKVRNCIGE